MRYSPKSPQWEDLLARLNEAVHGEFRGDELPGTAHPTVHVTGLPRTGTTLLMQTLAATRHVGYPSNIMAMFYRTPWIGAAIQTKLSSHASTTFQSLGGRTPEPLDPHEFGYFWRAALGHAGNELVPRSHPRPPEELRRELDLVTKVFRAPTVYKNFLAPAHLEYLHLVGNQKYVVMSRPLPEVAASLLQLRRQLGTPSNTWLGLAPPLPAGNFATDIERVAYQSAHLQQELEDSGILSLDATITVEYREFCESPGSTIERIFSHIGLSATRTIPVREITPMNPLNKLSTAERKRLSAEILARPEATST